MNKRVLPFLAFTALVFMNACTRDRDLNTDPPIGPGDCSNPAMCLVINEFMASNSNTILSPAGLYSDWIEIYNPNAVDVDLGGLFISDDINEPNKHQIPQGLGNATVVPAKGFLLIWADDSTELGPLHTNFGLSAGGEDVVLSYSDGVTIIDSYVYGQQNTDVSTGRTPDGGTWGVLTTPSPGSSNVSGGGGGDCNVPRLCLKLNEFMASNGSTIQSPAGGFGDWFEIYNPTNQAVDIGGMYVSDDLGNLQKYAIPTNAPQQTTIAAGGYMLIWADNTGFGPLHTPFALSASGEDLVLTDTDGITIVDSYSFGPQTSDVSEGRVPNGTGAFQILSAPSPGTANN